MAYMEFPKGQKGKEDRKSFWLSDNGLALITQWRIEGIPMEEIALKYIGVAEVTLWRWSKQSDKLVAALGMATDVVNAKVEQALIKRALGYTEEDEQWDLVEGELRRTRVTVHHIPPDVKACMHYLFNRRPDRWRVEQEPLESTKYVNTVKDILVAMKSVATTGEDTAVVAGAEDADHI